MAALARWLAPVALSAALGAAALTPTTARAQSGDDLVRVLVDVADVVMRGNVPYYRHGDYGRDTRLMVSYDRYGRPVYYRYAPRSGPYGHSYGYHGNSRSHAYQRTRCNSSGRCRVEYYDPRHDRRQRWDNGYYSRGHYDYRDRD